MNSNAPASQEESVTSEDLHSEMRYARRSGMWAVFFFITDVVSVINRTGERDMVDLVFTSVCFVILTFVCIMKVRETITAALTYIRLVIEANSKK